MCVNIFVFRFIFFLFLVFNEVIVLTSYYLFFNFFCFRYYTFIEVFSAAKQGNVRC